MQALSLIDVSMTVKDWVHGHAKGEARSDSVLLSAPLVSRGPLPPVHDTDCDDSDNVRLVQEAVMRNSKAVQLCKTLAEKKTGSHGLDLLPAESITASITENFKGAAPIYNSNMVNSVVLHPSFSFVATVDQQQHAVRKVPTGFKVGNIDQQQHAVRKVPTGFKVGNIDEQQHAVRKVPTGFKVGNIDQQQHAVRKVPTGFKVGNIDQQQHAVRKTPTGFKVGNITLREGRRAADLDFITRSNDESEEAAADGSGSESDVDAPVDEVVQRVADTFEQVTLELAIFTVLFPHAMGYLDGSGQFSGYLLYRMM
ncbi:hypothetical protein CEUSTIGMA_g5442.t1 [Chlamydomonas eustigma]|uniref:Uncharacterized protein n=1 Tax=Chlamydomonas eustigma TaxID=1157962 RepID=A0A250X5H1_9CHLO|nr:hypothetical protein CEUSTIGMA_g5442.t1 [Chlamydomonas eustigma]|eukprot:GAX78000.1 hypothetical protein CEUSTIGMA_g5442.t1 [Chlamydomonas eustigma]